MTQNIPITIANGDGVGPEMMHAVLCLLRDSGGKVHVDYVEIGLRAFHHGFRFGIPKSCMETILRNKILLKAPTITPDGQRHQLPPLENERRSVYEPDVAMLGLMPCRALNAQVIQNDDCVVFESMCDALLDIADEDQVNPSGMIGAAALMLAFIGQQQPSQTLGDAWLKTLEDGIHTADIYCDGVSRKCVGTRAFSEAVAERLGQQPAILTPFDSQAVFAQLEM